MTSTGIPNF